MLFHAFSIVAILAQAISAQAISANTPGTFQGLVVSGGLTSPAEITLASILSSDSGAGLALAFAKSVFYGDPIRGAVNQFCQ